MRDPERIDDVLASLRSYWKQNPDMRLTQVLWNFRPLGMTDRDTAFLFYNMEDEVTRKKLQDGLRDDKRPARL